MKTRSVFVFIILCAVLPGLGPGVTGTQSARTAVPLQCPGLALEALEQLSEALQNLGLPPDVVDDLSRWVERIHNQINANNAQAALGQIKGLSGFVNSLVKSRKISAQQGDVLLSFVDQMTSAINFCVAPVRGFSCRTSSTQNVLFWLNPSESFTSVRIEYRIDRFPIGPTDPNATVLGNFSGTPGSKGTTTHSGLINGSTYYYAAYVDNGTGAFSLQKTTFGRPESNPGIYWSYTVGGSRIPVPGIDGDYSIAAEDSTAAEDEIVYRLTGLGAGGYWQTPWIPPTVPNPVNDRPLTIPLTTPINGESQAVLVSSRQGRIFCLSRTTGSILWQSPYLGAEVRANICATLSAFGGLDILMVGTYDTTGDNTFYGLNVADGSIAWHFDNGGGTNGIGPIANMCAAQYPNHVIFASHRKAGGSQHTAWRLDFATTSASKLWSADVGDPSTSFVIVNSAAYVGTSAGEAKSIDFATGSPLWTPAYGTSDGPIKGFVFPDRNSGRLTFSTNNKVHLLLDQGSLFSQIWNPPLQLLTPSPSAVIIGTPWLFVGDGSGTVYQFDATSSTPTMLGSVTLGDPSKPKQTGPMTFDLRGVLLVGTDEGILYALKYPIAGSLSARITAKGSQRSMDGSSMATDQDCDCAGLQNSGVPKEVKKGAVMPREYALGQNYPNPFNPTTEISFALPEAAEVSLVVFNTLGQKVAALVNGYQVAGYHTVKFDASNFASGVYLYRMTTGKYVATRKLVVVK